MLDSWKQIDDDFNRLIRSLTAALSDPQVEKIVGLAMEAQGTQWTELTQSFRGLPTFPQNVVRVGLASDILTIMSSAVVSDGQIDDDEMQTAFDLSRYLVLYLSALERYRSYANLTYDDVRPFMETFQQDRLPFGGRGDGPTFLLSAKLTLAVASATGDRSHMQTFERIIQTILSLVFGGIPRCPAEVEFIAKIEKIFAALQGVKITTKSGANSTTTTTSWVTSGKSSVDEGFAKLIPEKSGAPTTENSLTPEASLQAAMSELDALVGLPGVKAEVKRLTAFLKIQQQRRKYGLRTSTQTLHFVFTGNPGTGKTTVARIVGKILYGFELLKSTNVVECSRADLVGGYVGQTAMKTQKKIESALDGVLFIDEAYTLSSGARHERGDTFGSEAINTLLKMMEDHRERLVVIVAGYPQLMQEFIETNPGLQSRFTRYLDFADFGVADLCRIFEKFCTDGEYVLSPESRALASILFTLAYDQRDERFGNARFIRNVFEQAIGLHSERVHQLPPEQITREVLMRLDGDDIAFDTQRAFDRTQFDLAAARWRGECDQCQTSSSCRLEYLGQRVTCRKCQNAFIFPWWNLVADTIPGVPGGWQPSSSEERL
ncbi:AAA family ATPase [Blastopirellula marina]|uniref:Probable stage V sporulation protein K n=1 Tax=Blastopirellula marina DSM 3645 TaxID=314230 RepID=A3ZSV5_9BACT|nr:AAA family ATPase [Blastopirellula marina]EAQ80380.1 probable stage V sporulation protein K [Blastopirellula marina DSM 3645]